MSFTSDPVASLRAPEVRKFFLDLLNSSMSGEEKYEAFIRFFEIEDELSLELQTQAPDPRSGGEGMADEAVAEAFRNLEAWRPELILKQTTDAIERALRRIGHSQHRDGGWGYAIETSHVWATTWTVLCLHRAAKLNFDVARLVSGTGASSPDLVERGLAWLVKNRRRWSLADDDLAAGHANSIYEASLVLRCLVETGAHVRNDLQSSLDGTVARLLEAQHPEGDWDSTLSRRGETQPDWSEVGATSFALQALAATERRDDWVAGAVRRGMEWLHREQNPEGSWNTPAYLPHTPEPVPSVNKTCDALKGLFAGKLLDLDVTPYLPGIERAVVWLRQQERAIFGEDGKIAGWGWEGAELPLLENTCLTLETLLEIKGVALPQLAANALWLVRVQRRVPGSSDDGKWPSDDTGRIACALLEFYCRVRDNPIFQPPSEEASPSGSVRHSPR